MHYSRNPRDSARQLLMISPDFFLKKVRELGVSSFFGVPDSLLKDFCLAIDQTEGVTHVITANEGAAIAAATGSYIAAGQSSLVYLQNSGLGNTVNPLLSLADQSVYGIPMVLLIGWRGEPGVSDEPQHVKQGRTTVAMLDAMEIPWHVLPTDESESAGVVEAAFKQAEQHKTPVALLVRKGTFCSYSEEKVGPPIIFPTREEALAATIAIIPEHSFVVASTGVLGRELYELRSARQKKGLDFLNVGAMGHAVSIALGFALAEPERPVWCLDGDGSTIMHMGSLAVAGSQGPANLHHVVFNNEVHDSVGGQTTAASTFSLRDMALAVGYKQCARATTVAALESHIKEFMAATGPSFTEMMVRPGFRSDLGRPREQPGEAIKELMGNLSAARRLKK